VTVTLTPPELPALVVGTVSHVRRSPVRRAFESAQYQWMVDLDALPRLPWGIRTLAGFHADDHLDRGRLGGGIRGDLSRWLASRGVHLEPGDRVLMLGHARALGHVFNPLTVFWCLRADGSVRAVVLEVHNTYGERHAYLVSADDRGRAVVEKAFYVSPFNDTSGHYEVLLRLTPGRVSVSVTLSRDGAAVFTAVSTGRPTAATPGAVVRTFGRHLFMTHRVSLLIRWHGLRLWLARLAIEPRPAHSQEAVR
jgi:uncharacterized protein